MLSLEKQWSARGENSAFSSHPIARYSPFTALTIASILSGGAIAGMEQPLERVKNPRPEDVALSGAPSKGAERMPSDPAVVGVMEYGSNGLELAEGS